MPTIKEPKKRGGAHTGRHPGRPKDGLSGRGGIPVRFATPLTPDEIETWRRLNKLEPVQRTEWITANLDRLPE
jgi:hypothetical protein